MTPTTIRIRIEALDLKLEPVTTILLFCLDTLIVGWLGCTGGGEVGGVGADGDGNVGDGNVGEG
ncbi:hypothetical protein CON65_17860 [Bacillus pseudomycoides]|uniref:Uncharacterized protein n=1 Tax=Bacillus pseudomycoides TaxID=64104 RepID=A0AA91VB56_9BACI|nr:hypothetical protein [Bacillus sp. AFS014408]PEB50098.1 hypothetical protein COO03_23725 [Bacillus sp. AFS098217]PED81378.1 hypothetical protein CON65_17860 [Bacillus pseudomycoides]PEU08704.1 hypothetical protein CN525_25570 [Bacillus sp. AFS014408]PEU13478.1 hypothetical protein CN524_11480 [Bacillus sp. AFS019443]